jgi:hypothetical protein
MLQRLNIRHWHQLTMYVLVVLAIVIQSFFVAKFSTSWLHVDLITIVLVYMAIEHQLFYALLCAAFAALFLQTLSSAPNGFFFMYHAQILVVATLVARRVVLWSAVSQYALFIGLLILKYILFAIFVVSLGRVFLFMPFLWAVLPSVLVTSLMAIPGFRLLAALDYHFQIQRGREESSSSFI